MLVVRAARVGKDGRGVQQPWTLAGSGTARPGARNAVRPVESESRSRWGRGGGSARASAESSRLGAARDAPCGSGAAVPQARAEVRVCVSPRRSRLLIVVRCAAGSCGYGPRSSQRSRCMSARSAAQRPVPKTAVSATKPMRCRPARVGADTAQPVRLSNFLRIFRNPS